MKIKLLKVTTKSYNINKNNNNNNNNINNNYYNNNNETYKYLGILEADTIKQVEMKDRIQKEYFRRTRKLLKTKPSNRNLIKGINT